MEHLTKLFIYIICIYNTYIRWESYNTKTDHAIALSTKLATVNNIFSIYIYIYYIN